MVKWKKYYQAILTGELPDDVGTLTNYLVHDAGTNVTRIADKDTPGAKHAELDYEVLDVMETDTGIFELCADSSDNRKNAPDSCADGRKKSGRLGRYKNIIRNSRKQRKRINRLDCMRPDWNLTIR